MAILKLTFQAMILSAMWLPSSMKNSVKKILIYRIYQFLIFSCFVMIFFGEFGFVIRNMILDAKIDDYSEVLYIAPLGVLTLIKIVYIAFNRKKVSELIKILKSDACKSLNPEETELEEKWENFIR